LRCRSVAWLLELRIKFFLSIGGYGVFVVIGNRDPGVCYGFINPEVNHFVFQMRGKGKTPFDSKGNLRYSIILKSLTLLFRYYVLPEAPI